MTLAARFCSLIFKTQVNDLNPNIFLQELETFARFFNAVTDKKFTRIDQIEYLLTELSIFCMRMGLFQARKEVVRSNIRSSKFMFLFRQ